MARKVFTRYWHRYCLRCGAKWNVARFSPQDKVICRRCGEKAAIMRSGKR